MSVAAPLVDVVSVTRARFVGMGLLSLIVLIHNWLIVPGMSLGWSCLVVGVMLGYAAAVGAILRVAVRHPVGSPLHDIFLGVDILVWAFAIYGTGGHQSWLIFLMIMRAI